MIKAFEMIDHHYQSILLDNTQLSSFIDETAYQLLFIRELKLESNAIEFETNCFLFLEEKILYFDRAKKTFQKLKSKAEFLNFCMRILNQNKEIVKTLSFEVEALEDQLFDRTYTKRFIDDWFDLRNEFSKIERYTKRLIEVFQDFFKFKKQGDKLKKSEFGEINASIQYSQAMVRDELSRLDTLHHYYLSIKGDRLNRSIYLLTVISGVFLPLNLVVGFFGMNTENLYFKDEPMGTTYVFYILSSIIVVLICFLPLLRFLDRLILNRFFGNATIYQKLNGKMKKISDSFKVD